MKRRRFFKTVTATLLAFLMVAVLATPATAQGNSGNNKNKDKDGDGGTEEPVLPPVEYTVHNFAPPQLTNSLRVNDMSNTGLVVGHYVTSDGLWHGWLYDAVRNPNVAIDLNDLEIEGVPEGAFIGNALGVNDVGMVVGYVAYDDAREQRRGFVLDALSSPPTLSLLPNLPFTHSYARGINDNFDIVGVFRRDDETWGAYIYNPIDDEQMEIVDVDLYAPSATELNNPLNDRRAQIVSTTSDYVPFVYTRGQIELGPEYLLDAAPAIAGVINDESTVCGVAFREEEEVYRRNKTRVVTNRYLFRYSEVLTLFEESKNDPGKSGVVSINSHGAILTRGGGSGDRQNYIYTDDWGFVDVAALVNHPEPWNLVAEKMNDSAVYGFGELAGFETTVLADGTTTTILFVLTPLDTTPQ